ncbi:LamG-like jellyroll fold domain-containing protein [Pelosinus baikalensis]|uniref:Fibronectin type-III domain-containing protein n=1 Tax=Pelosinus baikalensis TaxID=2892015 RepID=A0ABS8HZU1_9FIRM|nr:LamG-like jellyroll fold domain-containing protein [Pelosinus baikalensis]MCC5468660.1 hypothetical protein [Pelosinus baikalensis]
MYEVDQYTVSLLHFEDGLKDECGNTWTATGSPTVDTTQKVVGNSSLYSPTGASLTSVINKCAFGTGDFTVDFWARSANLKQCLFASSAIIGGAVGVSINGDWVWVGNNGQAEGILRPGTTLSDNTWTHIAAVRSQGQFMLFVQGKLVQQAKMSSAITSTHFAIGSRYGDVPGGYRNTQPMFIDEFRISNVARWTTDFTPPNTTTETIDAPTNLTASAGDSQVSLSWNAVEGAASYNVKRSTTAGGPYTTIATNVTGASYVDSTVTNGTTYYYVVTAVDSNGNESASSNEASATPQAPSGQALLRVTMIDSSEREYQLSAFEIDGFINWYTRTVDTGTTCYMLNKNIGLQNSKEYLAFDKVISFEVMELTK